MIKALTLIAALAVAPTAMAEGPSKGEYRNSVKWQEYQSRRAERKAQARYMSAELRGRKDGGRVSLTRVVNVNRAMPFGHLYVAPRVYCCPRYRFRPIIVINY